MSEQVLTVCGILRKHTKCRRLADTHRDTALSVSKATRRALQSVKAVASVLRPAGSRDAAPDRDGYRPGANRAELLQVLHGRKSWHHMIRRVSGFLPNFPYRQRLSPTRAHHLTGPLLNGRGGPARGLRRCFSLRASDTDSPVQRAKA